MASAACGGRLVALVLALVALAGGARARRACSEPLVQQLRDAAPLPDGGLRVGQLDLPRGLFWRNASGAWGCPCVLRPCLFMCCARGHVYNGSACEPHPAADALVADAAVPLRDARSGQTVRAALGRRFLLRHEPICRNRRVFLEPDVVEEDEFVLATDGRLLLPNSNDIKEADVGRFCAMYVVVAGKDQPEFGVLLCIPTPLQHRLSDAVYPATMAVSCVLLLVTFLVYAVLPDLRNFPGHVLMSYVPSLLVGYVFNGIVRIFPAQISDDFCISAAFIIYFAFLASFFWLNVMCLDIWWTFSGFRPMRGSVKEREHKKFIIYSLYCWGSPLIMLIICMVMDLHPDIPDSYIKPGFGELKCWFKSNLGNFIYFSGPIAILIICNIILFILTAVKIQQVKRGTKILKKQDSRRHNEEEENNAQRFNLYFKLFLVMGVNWIMEIVSFAAGGPDEYWYITDIANTLQDRIRKLLMERFCPGRAANTNSLNNSSSTRTTGIRHNGSVMSSHRPSFKNKDDYQMKTLTSPSARL
ncbi:G-protein coupled receptor Mth2 [Gryllus bimaculatus]|nr:G-protein coupled receptor Mth2 [Gryllus bimaculatus]